MTVKLPTTKRLFAVAGNTCAFADCERRLVKADVVVGQICHIRAKEKGGPRYEPSYPDPDAYENLILMYGEHQRRLDCHEHQSAGWANGAQHYQCLSGRSAEAYSAT